MKALKGFWQFLNTDVKDIPWKDVADQGIEALKSLPDAKKAWEENADKIQQLAPLLDKAEPLVKALDTPVANLAISAVPFVSVGINLLKIGLDLTKVEPNFENSVAIVAQLAFLESLEKVLKRQNKQTLAKLQKLSLIDLIEKQLSRLDAIELTATQATKVTTQFQDSVLAEPFGMALTEKLKQVGLDQTQSQQIADQVLWSSPRYFHRAMAGAGKSVAPLVEYYSSGGLEAQERFDSIDNYLNKQIKTAPLEQVFDESKPKVCFNDIYVQLEVQPLTQEGDVQSDSTPLCSHKWAKRILEQTSDQKRKVMFLEGEAGRGKSVFCRMIANRVCSELGDAFIPLRIRLRDLHQLENNLTKTLTDCPDLEPLKFVQRDSDWLTNQNTRFFIILDGFDELLLERRDIGGLKEFLQQVTDFQGRNHHQLLVTGRPLALQGIDRLISQNQDLERVRLEPMGDPLREKWLDKWQEIFKEETVQKLREFLTACPKDITNTLAREPLLLYLLARLNREGHLTQKMFAETQAGDNQETQAKLRIYRASVDWVLEQQRQDENIRLSGLDELADLREVLQEAALCVVQSGNETARLDMVKQRFNDSSNPISDLLKKSQETTGQSEDKALNNLLTTFYLKPGEKDKRGSVEFAHKSFGEYLFAERLLVAFEDWTEFNQRKRKFSVGERAFHEQLYDVFGYGGLSQEIVAYLWELLEESHIDRELLFQRFHQFYLLWCQHEFLDAAPNENLPQKKLLQLRDQGISSGLRTVDVFAGLNVMILLFKLHAASQLDEPHLSDDASRSHLHFYPCGEYGTEDFEAERLLKNIYYADSLGVGTFTKTVGPYLTRADLIRANLIRATLTRANLEKANLKRANLDSANLIQANLKRANLDSTNLIQANLKRANLDSTNLIQANLDSANLEKANLKRANLDSANLEKANLIQANLIQANLDSANLEKANLDSANLEKANLKRANLDSANLKRANLIQANLYSANLYSANLYSANLEKANLIQANLDSTNLDSANLEKANLEKANLYSANLIQANLYSANLIQANLKRANLDSANLIQANLYSANLDSTNLIQANLYSANLDSTNLIQANLYSANLIQANLKRANLDSANLDSANLDSANLDSANLDSANLKRANLQRSSLNRTLLLNTSLSATRNLLFEQFMGDSPPLICNAPLPSHIDIDPNRDWDILAPCLLENFPRDFDSLEQAQNWVEENRSS